LKFVVEKGEVNYDKHSNNIWRASWRFVEGSLPGCSKKQWYVPNYVKALSIHPEVYDAWTKLIGAVRGNMRLRRYELVTFASALALKCTYWLLAHGAVLRKNFFQVDQLISIVKDFRNADLSSEEVALMAFAQKITLDAAQVAESDFDELRKFGLSDQEILDVVVTCTARNFFSKTLDSLDVEPDAIYKDMEPELLKTLILGRPL
jgi:uncharacterized peroxidase-related enzyme